jgi:carboxyl-terminal processing protease
MPTSQGCKLSPLRAQTAVVEVVAMATRIHLACWLTVSLWVSAAVHGEEPSKASAKPSPDAAAFERFWKLSELVLDNHLDPPSRQEMFLGGVKGLFAQAQAPAPADLSRNVSRLTSAEHFATFLAENWPQSAGERTAAPEELASAFLRGALARVPGQPDFLPEHVAKGVEAVAANRYVGTGIQISVNAKENLTQIVNPFANGPARKAGAKPGDLIVQVDGVSMEGLKLQDVVERIRGEEGTNVTFTVRQPGEKETRLLKMTRGPVPFETVVGYQRMAEDCWQYRVKGDEPIAYLRVESVLPSTPSELRKLERTLLADGIKGLVLDMRFTSGGEVQPAALTADELLDGGLMWRVRDGKDRAKEYRADRDCLFRDRPLVVLVDKHTRGGPEFVAAALQDNGRGVIVGEATQGEGFVTTMFHLPDDQGAVQLRTGRVERAMPAKAPTKAPAAGWRPVTPDHVVALEQAKATAIMVWQSAQHLPEPPADAPKTPPDDPQLAKALDLIRTALTK